MTNLHHVTSDSNAPAAGDSDPTIDFAARFPILNRHWPNFAALVQETLGTRIVGHLHIEHPHVEHLHEVAT